MATKTLTLDPGRYRLTISDMSDYDDIVEIINIEENKVFKKDFTTILVEKSRNHNINDIPHGRYNISLTKEGYNPINREIRIPEDIESIKNLTLTKI